MDESITSYCGLCCADCIPSKAEFFELIERFESMLEELQFDKYAELKSEANAEFKEYPKFVSILDSMKALRCSGPCRLGGGKRECIIRDCVQKKGLKGCWECGDRLQCGSLNRLRTIHPNLDYHLDLIKELGPEKWLEKRKEHYRWQVE